VVKVMEDGCYGPKFGSVTVFKLLLLNQLSHWLTFNDDMQVRYIRSLIRVTRFYMFG
jgi:hypothetical protein